MMPTSPLPRSLDAMRNAGPVPRHVWAATPWIRAPPCPRLWPSGPLPGFPSKACSGSSPSSFAPGLDADDPADASPLKSQAPERHVGTDACRFWPWTTGSRLHQVASALLTIAVLKSPIFSGSFAQSIWPRWSIICKKWRRCPLSERLLRTRSVSSVLLCSSTLFWFTVVSSPVAVFGPQSGIGMRLPSLSEVEGHEKLLEQLLCCAGLC